MGGLHAGINRAAALGKSTVPLTIISVLSLLLATLLVPRHRILVPVGGLLYAPAGLGAASWFGGQSPGNPWELPATAPPERH